MPSMLLIVVAIITAITYWWNLWYNHYWKRVGIPYISPLPLIGSFYNTLIGSKSFPEEIVDTFLLQPNEKIVGYYTYGFTSLMIRDPDVIRTLTVRDHDYFLDHGLTFVNEETEPYLSKTVILSRGQKWRHYRSTISPTYTSAKMKGMFEMVSKCAEQLAQHCHSEYDKAINLDSQGWMAVEFKDICGKFATDVIATTAFGLEINTFTDPNNAFYVMAGEMAKTRPISLLLSILLPNRIKRMFNITIYSDSLINYFKNMLNETIIKRERENIIRTDMIHLLMQARRGNLKTEEPERKDQDNGTEFAVLEEKIHKPDDCKEKASLRNNVLSLDEITAQAFTFLLAGAESISTVFSLGAFQIAQQPEIIARLQKEIDQTMIENDGTLTYDLIKNMPYLDMVLSEALRMYPAVMITDRYCTKPYTFELDGKKIPIKPGMVLHLMIIGIHMDPKNYPNPERFDPERFNAENRTKIQPYTYLPFGSGPRACIASRFAVMELKIAFAHLFGNFDLSVIPQTPNPIKWRPHSITFMSTKGVWLGLKPRKNCHFKRSNI